MADRKLPEGGNYGRQKLSAAAIYAVLFKPYRYFSVNKGDVSIFKKLLLDFISFYKTRNISLQRERPKRMGK
jgi:hypothetical protein